jgi:hypothetical protein
MHDKIKFVLWLTLAALVAPFSSSHTTLAPAAGSVPPTPVPTPLPTPAPPTPSLDTLALFQM